jgi:hypothetical protein
MKWKKRVNVLSVLVLIILCFSIVGCAASPLPSAHNITGVTQHKQINGLSCGPAALEIMFNFWGADINQKSIADVARSSSIGTYTWDMVRTGHFSHLSAAHGRFFPHDAPTAGFPERRLGYASFNYSSDTFWWSELKALIAADIPVILLMKYAPSDDTGHYRVIVGYDEDKSEVYFMDPWERDQGRVTNPDGTVTWNMTDFKTAWNYYDKSGITHPYWGAVMMPWSVNLRTSGKATADSMIKVTADIKYPCPQPFDCSSYPASNTSAEIHLPPNMNLSGSSSSFTIDIGNLAAGKSTTVSWVLRVNADASGSAINVSARGQVSGAVPQVYWNGNHFSYPAYNYTDEIGVEASINP